MKFRKKPIVIDAVQWINNNIVEIVKFCPKARRDITCLRLQTLEGVMTVDPNDWIIKGVKGEFYPCKPDIFEMTYERV